MPSFSQFAKSGIFQAGLILAPGVVLLFAGGCNNSCFVGVINPPNNSLTVVASTPPPVCSLSQTMTAVKVVANMVPSCANCAASQQVSHVYLYLSGIELHPGTVADENSLDWQELAPDLAKQSRLVDLAGEPASHAFAMPFEVTGHVPAGTYYQLRLRLSPAVTSRSQSAESAGANPCAASGHASCLVNADGNVHALQAVDGHEYMSVQLNSPLDVRPGRLNQIDMQLRPEWSLRKTSAGSVELAPFIQGEVVGNSNLPIGALN
ncbi:MAG TPA: DUF4382 domain-containing protein [Candidatus Acidoferrum sp.]|jgi:hypothetical protein